MRKPPVVTGVSPNEGRPGQLVTLRGENLGNAQTDLIGLSICGVDCTYTARWENSNKIIARCPASSKGVFGHTQTGHIVVCTKTGGQGASTVSFTIKVEHVGPTTDCAYWIDESRTVPVRQMGPVTAMPAAMLDDDVLGIGTSRAGGVRVDGLEGSTNLRMENFNSMLFLLSNYRDASFDDLKRGVQNLHNQESAESEAPKDFFKTNIAAFSSCVDALTSLEARLAKDRERSGTSSSAWLDHIASSVQHSKRGADGLFADVLSRKDQADSTRNALSILTRFKFLFFLPSAIEKNLEKGDYATILNEYNRARSLFSETDIGLFREAFGEVELKMKEFHKRLTAKLLKMPPIPLTEQRKIIQHLLQIDPNTDPCWECMIATHGWILEILWEEQKKQFKAAQRNRRLTAEIAESSLLTIEMQQPQRFQFCDGIITILTQRVPDFYRLVQAYTAHASVLYGNTQHAKANQRLSDLLFAVFQQATWLVLNALLPDTLSTDAIKQCGDRLVRWPRDELQHGQEDTYYMLPLLSSLRGCISRMRYDGLAIDHIQPLYDLNLSIRLRCLNRMLERTVDDIHALQSRDASDVWRLTSQTEDYAKSHLVDLFERAVNDILVLMRQVSVPRARDEADLFESEKLRSALIRSFQHLLSSFAATLGRLARLSPSPDQGTGAPLRPGNLQINQQQQVQPPIKDRKLLVVLSNADYVARYSLRSLSTALSNCGGLRYVEDIVTPVKQRYQALAESLQRAYCGAKAAVFDELLGDDVQAISDEAVSDHLNDALLCMVAVRQELYTAVPHFMARILPQIGSALVDRLLACPNASLSYMDLYAAQTALTPLTSEATRLTEVLRLRSSQEPANVKAALAKYMADKKLLLAGLRAQTMENGS